MVDARMILTAIACEIFNDDAGVEIDAPNDAGR